MSAVLFGLSEPALRSLAFFGVLALMLVAERLFPRRRRVAATLSRWGTNGALVILGTVLVRVVGGLAPALTAVGAALLAAEHGFGLFHAWTAPLWLQVIVTLLVLDFAVWLQHVAFHTVPALWRVHRVHHADRDLDATSALRFHPIEIVISSAYKAVVVAALGAPAAAVIAFEILLNACATFNHANLALPRWLDAGLRLVLVTPDMHRVHHSIHRDEHDTNFGFCLSVWDRLFGRYAAAPRGGHDGMTVGLADHQDAAPAKLRWALGFPFQR